MKYNEIDNVITADEGMWLTNGVTYTKEAMLGRVDTPSNWHEITEEEYQELLRKQEEQVLGEV